MNDFDKDPSIGAALLAWLFEAAPFGLLVTGTDLKILYANGWFRRSLGGAAGPIIGLDLFETFPDLPFILIGDTSQKDPEIYREIVRAFPGRIPAVYIRNVEANPERSAAVQKLAEEVLKEGQSRGFGMTRLWANMEWALEELPGVHDIVEYETRLNYVLPKYEDPVICAYDTTKFSAGLVMDMLRTHPVVLIGGMLRENPFFVPPDEFLAELRERRSAHPTC